MTRRQILTDTPQRPTGGPMCARAGRAAALGLAVLAAMAPPAHAQLDPLIGVKRLPPNIIVVLDTSLPMLFDGDGNYYDVKTYTSADDPDVGSSLGVTGHTQYRRMYVGLAYETRESSTSKFSVSNIVATPAGATGYATFWAPTRFETARAGLAQAVLENQELVRWGLLKLRQNGPSWRNPGNSSACDGPVRVTGNVSLNVSDTSPCSAGPDPVRHVIYDPASNGPNYGQTSSPGDSVVYAVGSSSAAANIRTAMLQAVGSGFLIPAGQGADTYADRPIYHALIDARAHAESAIAADASTAGCRNTVVVLVTSGKDDGSSAYLAHGAISSLAGTFATVTAGSGTRRVPVVVIGVKPAAADEAELQAIASASGGRYFRATRAADVTRAVNLAVQLGFSNSTDVDAVRPSEFSSAGPIVGTVNLAGARSATGALLPETHILATRGPTAGVALPQRSNMLLTASYTLPGFDGRLRAFRVYKPVPDSTSSTGWRFLKDGTRLWPDLDNRPELAGIARTPLSSDSRNIYTVIPDSSGSGGQMVAFSIANSAVLGPHLGGADPSVLIPAIRAQPLGAIISSTPAILESPALDPSRRSLIFFGANDGMLHAVDARTGYEVWAFIPYNLLPKLETLLDGQPVEQFSSFVDSSPTIAEVKLGGSWKTLLVIGEGYGGTFYQAFDITEAGMGVDPTSDSLGAVTAMLARFDAPGEQITFSWAFPRYASFDPNVLYTASSLGNTFPGGRLTFFGDLKTTASNVEKRVGFTFSGPAVGSVAVDRSTTAVITASGFFPAVEADLPGRGGSAPEAGHSLFLLDGATGLPLGNPTGSACAGTGCVDVGSLNPTSRKNAIQADVTASSDSGSTVVNRAYVGDLDGRYWRFDFTSAGVITSTMLTSTGQPIYSSSALLPVGTTERYLFFSTGSDRLPNTAPGGGSGSGTAFNLYGLKDGPASGTVMFAEALSPKVTSSPSDLITNGERPTASPSVAGDIVFFATVTDGASLCADAITKVYAFTYAGTAAYDSNGNNRIDNHENPVVVTSTGRGTAPFIADQHLVLGTSSSLGAGVTLLGDSEDFNNGVGRVGVRILSWREIR